MDQARLILFSCILGLTAGWGLTATALAQPTPAAVDTPATSSEEPTLSEKRSVIPTTPSEVVTALGWWGLPFGIATLISLWFSTERLVVLRRARVIPKPFVERFLHHLREGTIDPVEALELCDENGSPVAQIFEHGVRKWGKPSVEVEQAIIDGGERQISQMRKNLRVMNGVATVSPLIGLLGTVWGMIDAFNGIAGSDAMGSPEKLAAGIALALLTTAAGLLVAIPSMIIYMYLSGRVDRLVMDMDTLAQEVVYSISAEALHERPRAS
ncbi:MAG: MotA/TolQ/ExbB proton channel family protein [Planctomycetaceae bacterium]|nr:MotA/TolQ/ExbB proton channel family protein [Planctomycetaceae bacterium]